MRWLFVYHFPALVITFFFTMFMWSLGCSFLLSLFCSGLAVALHITKHKVREYLERWMETSLANNGTQTEQSQTERCSETIRSK